MTKVCHISLNRFQTTETTRTNLLENWAISATQAQNCPLFNINWLSILTNELSWAYFLRVCKCSLLSEISAMGSGYSDWFDDQVGLELNASIGASHSEQIRIIFQSLNGWNQRHIKGGKWINRRMISTVPRKRIKFFTSRDLIGGVKYWTVRKNGMSCVMIYTFMLHHGH